MERRYTVNTDRESSQKNGVEPMSYLEVLTGRRRSSSDEKESPGKKWCVVTSNVIQIRETSEDKDSSVLGQEDQKELSRKEVPLDMSNVDALTTHNTRYQETDNIQEMKQETSWKKSDLAVTYLNALMGRNTLDCNRKTSRKKLSHDSGHGDDLIELNSEEEYLNIQGSLEMERIKRILETNCKDAWTKCKDEDDSAFIEDDELEKNKSPYVNTSFDHSSQDEVTKVQVKEKLLPRRYVDVLTGRRTLDETDSNNENSLKVKSSLAMSYVDAVTEQSSQENEAISNQEDELELSWKDALTGQDGNDSVDETDRNETFLEIPVIAMSSQYEENVTIDEEELTKIKPRHYTSYMDALIGRCSQDETVIVHDDLESLHTKSNLLSNEDISTEINTDKSSWEGSDKQWEASYRDSVTSQTGQDEDETGFSALDELQRIESSEDCIPVNVTIHLEERLTKKPSHSPQSYVDVFIGRSYLDVKTNKEQFSKKESLPVSYASAVTGKKYLEDKKSDCIKISSDIPHEETNATNSQRSLDNEDSVTIPTSSSPVHEEGHLPLVLEIPGSRIISNSIESDPKVLERREKQILYGKNTESYKKYLEIVDKEKRSPRMPRTPNVKCKMNRRQWDGLVRNWKRRIHLAASKFDLDGKHADVLTSGSASCSNWVEIMEEEDRLKEMEEKEGKMDSLGSCYTSWT